jgi:hypothetical protein
MRVSVKPGQHAARGSDGAFDGLGHHIFFLVDELFRGLSPGHTSAIGALQ